VERSLELPNEIYSVYAIAEIGSSQVVLHIEELILDEDSSELFVILDESSDSSTGYSLTFMNQTQ